MQNKDLFHELFATHSEAEIVDKYLKLIADSTADLKSQLQMQQKIAELERILKDLKQNDNTLANQSNPTTTHKEQRPKKVTKAKVPRNELEQGVWTDPKTNLMWARISIGQEWVNGECVGNAKTLSWDSTKKACKNFCLLDYKDWRLPTIEELKTLLLSRQEGYNCPKSILFKPNKKNYGQYWSSTESSFSLASGVSFVGGYRANYRKQSRYYARAVRNI